MTSKTHSGDVADHSHEDTWGATEEYKRQWFEDNAETKRAKVAKATERAAKENEQA